MHGDLTEGEGGGMVEGGGGNESLKRLDRQFCLTRRRELELSESKVWPYRLRRHV